ncbi:porin [Paraburkholderia caffeinilytica]|uniref:porin n=1 Tax=Paraburkholderia caffeinilytica TaxID=1761016 RepID=UPI003DA0453F
MKLTKHWFWPATFFLATSAMAQSSITLYGNVDASVYYQSRSPGNTGSAYEFLDGGLYPSFWGLTGKEDLGNGVKIGFKLESGFSSGNGTLSNGNDNFFGRFAYVEAETPVGTVRAGTQFSPFFFAVIDTDPQNFPNHASGIVPYLATIGGAGVVNSNTVSYSSPDVAGFSGAAMYGFGGMAGNFKASAAMAFSGKYSRHGLLAEVAYYHENDSLGQPSAIARLAGVSYQFGPVRVSTVVTNFKAPANAIGNVNVYAAGAAYGISPDIQIGLGIYASRDQDHSENRSMLYGLNGEYLLSKRTMLYAQVGVVNNKGNMGTGLNSQGGPQTFTGFPPGTTVAANLGINHSF